MNQVTFEFKVQLVDPYRQLGFPGTTGLITKGRPLNRQFDSLTLNTRDSDRELRVKFDSDPMRCALLGTYGELLDPVDEVYEIDPATEAFSAPELRGNLVVRNVSDSDMDALRHCEVAIPGDVLEQRATEFMQSVIATIAKSVTDLLDIFRITFGQYWIQQLRSWDEWRSWEWGSPRNAAATYCQQVLNLRMQIENGDSCQVLRQTDVSPFEIPPVLNRAYIDQQDFAQIRDLVAAGFNPDFAARCLIRAHQMRTDRNMSLAIIDGCTALEVAFASFTSTTRKVETDEARKALLSRLNLGKGSAIRGSGKAKGPSQREGLGSRVTRLCKTYSELEVNDYSLFLVRETVLWRNDLLHEGIELPSSGQLSVHENNRWNAAELGAGPKPATIEVDSLLEALFFVTAKLIGEPSIRRLQPLSMHLQMGVGSSE